MLSQILQIFWACICGIREDLNSNELTAIEHHVLRGKERKEVAARHRYFRSVRRGKRKL